jgi:hypothetical protein
MIIPAGKRRTQVNQGGCKHESMTDYDLFKKIALQEVGEIPKETEAPDVDPALQDTVNDSSSPKMNPAAKPAKPGMESDPTGQPGQEDPNMQRQTGGLEGKVNEIVRAVLEGLQIDSTQWLVTNSSVSDGNTLTSIKIEMKRKPAAQKAVEYPTG